MVRPDHGNRAAELSHAGGGPVGPRRFDRRSEAGAGPQSPDAEEPTLTGTLYLWPEDVTALHAELVERGVVVERGPEVMEYGMREFAVCDPNGYLLEFGEPA